MSREEFPESSQFDESSAESNSSSQEEAVKAERIAVLEAIAVWHNDQRKQVHQMSIEVNKQKEQLQSREDILDYRYKLGEIMGRHAVLRALSDVLILESRSHEFDFDKTAFEEE